MSHKKTRLHEPSHRSPRIHANLVETGLFGFAAIDMIPKWFEGRRW